MVFLYQHIVEESSKYRSIDHPGQSLTSLSGDPPQFFYIFRVHEDHLIDKRGIRLACAYHEGTGFPGGDNAALLSDHMLDKVLNQLNKHIIGVGNVKLV